MSSTVQRSLRPQDLSQPSEIASSLDLVQSKYGKLDILVLSAGLFSNNEFAEEDIEVSRRMIDVNLTSVVQLTHAALPLLKRQERSEILAIGSIAGVSDMRNEAVYSATKHALNAFLRSLRRQVAKDGVRVTFNLARHCGHRIVGAYRRGRHR